MLYSIFKHLPQSVRKRLFLVYALSRRAMTLGVRGIVQDGEGRVLLLRHTYVNGWHLPGGGVERGETAQQAMAKELQEETGLSLSKPARLFHFYKNNRTSQYDHVAVFVCDSWEGELRETVDHEIAEIGFFSLDDLPAGITSQTHDRLKELLLSQPVSDIW